ncbi:putative ABC transporter permease protein YurN [Vallitalea longa]|uniref:ABC transporter permease protein YurN n=1 Tax=Vallitalea longa TaxID=2936439 RepID=A0A9W6DEU9_9FIRM|nr:sugar ABC transporter permease [Vallitalea longa]GKX27964.1 putative ABC transporter permease protein YurN [Vallitalea longa]
MKKDISRRFYPMWLATPAIVIYSLFFIIPVVLSLVLSFTDWNLLRITSPSFSGFKNYIELFKDPIFIKAIFNTLLFAITTCILKTVFGLLLALVLVKKFKGNSFLRTLYYLPCVLSTVVIGVLFTAILDTDGLLNNILNAIGLGNLATNWLGSYGTAMTSVILIESWMWAGFCMFIFISGLQAIPKDYYECADIEGCNKFQQFFKITLPLLVPSFTVVITLNISGALKVFDIIYVLTNGGPGFDTQVLNTYTYRSFGLGLLGESAASAIILSIIVVAISFFFNLKLKSKEVEM